MPSRLCLLALLLAGVSSATAQQATQDVTVVVEEVSEISVSTNNLTLTLDSATPGGEIVDATDATSTYSVSTNGTGKKITAQLDSDYASGITLRVGLEAPAAATAGGPQALSAASAVDLVTALSKISASGLVISYTASATAAAEPNGTGETKTVTFTVTD